MAAVYPGTLPTKEAAGANLSTNPHSQLHDDMYDEIVAIATELGTDPAGSSATVKARLTAMVNPYSGVLTSWVPTLSQGGAVAATTNYARYQRTGRMISGNLKMTITGSGVAANNIFIGVPVTPATDSVSVGSGFIVDASSAVGSTHGIAMLFNSANFVIYGASNAILGIGASGFGALAINDVIYLNFQYEALAD